jgi:hypothetical protein
MGTNYYLKHSGACPTCGHADNDLHIGKSSRGWNFGLRIYPKLENAANEHSKPFGVDEILELDDWRPLFAKYQIIDESGNPVATEDMLRIITQRSHPRGLISRCTAGPEHMGRYGVDRDARPGEGSYDLCNY